MRFEIWDLGFTPGYRLVHRYLGATPSPPCHFNPTTSSPSQLHHVPDRATTLHNRQPTDQPTIHPSSKYGLQNACSVTTLAHAPPSTHVPDRAALRVARNTRARVRYARTRKTSTRAGLSPRVQGSAPENKPSEPYVTMT